MNLLFFIHLCNLSNLCILVRVTVDTEPIQGTLSVIHPGHTFTYSLASPVSPNSMYLVLKKAENSKTPHIYAGRTC